MAQHPRYPTLHSFKSPSILALASLLALSALGCSDDDDETATLPLAGQSFVLVHGAWNGAWVWEDVQTELEAQGASTVAVELTAHGDDMTDGATTTMAGYVEQVGAALEQAGGNAVLVGHSFGGMVVSATAERYPERIERMIYVGAFFPSDGQSALDIALTDSASDLGAVLQIDVPAGVARVPREQFAEIFCADCDERGTALMTDRYRDEPLGPVAEPLSLSPEGFGSVEKYYVYTALDRVLSPALQMRMTGSTELAGTVTLQVSHSPFLARPAELVATFADLVAR